MASRRVVLHAAQLLEEEAELTRQSCEIAPRNWACADCADKTTCSSRQRYEELARTARQLRGQA